MSVRILSVRNANIDQQEGSQAVAGIADRTASLLII